MAQNRGGRWPLVAWSAWLPCLVVAGCGGGPDLPPMANVTGTVTLDGKPLPRGSVQFAPDPTSLPKGAKAATAVGLIDAEGHYTLKTAGVEGAIVGRHQVSVEARQEPKNEMDTWPPSLIPEKYNTQQTSGLTFEVKAGEDNVIDIPLKLTP